MHNKPTAAPGCDEPAAAWSARGPDHVVAAPISAASRVFGLSMAAAVVFAIGLGMVRALTSALPARQAAFSGLLMAEVVSAAALILLGSVVEGFGSGLSLGTHWPYTRNIITLMLRGDSEAAHRVLATAVGLFAVALVVLSPDRMSLLGLGLIVATALFGMGTLYVLAGRAPALVHGVHGLLAYLVFLNYLTGITDPGTPLTEYLKHTVALHSVLFAILLGGMVTGRRGFGRPIEAFQTPRRAAQWMFVCHGFAALLVIGTLGWLSAAYPVAFALALAQAAVGFFLFQGINLRPHSPGAIVVFHQSMALLIATAIVLPRP